MKILINEAFGFSIGDKVKVKEESKKKPYYFEKTDDGIKTIKNIFYHHSPLDIENYLIFVEEHSVRMFLDDMEKVYDVSYIDIRKDLFI
jgi:hypothetical protein